MWSINFSYHLYQLVPWFLRLPKRMAWLQVMISQLEEIQALFLLFRDDANRRATYNGQVMVLERMLNLNYYDEDIWATPVVDTTAGGHIYITHILNTLPGNYVFYNDEVQEPLYIYNDSEGETPEYVYNSSEYYSITSFVVNVPVALVYEEAEMRARIDALINAGYNYIIQTY